MTDACGAASTERSSSGTDRADVPRRKSLTPRMLLGWFMTVLLLCGALVFVPVGDVTDAIARADKKFLALTLVPVMINLGLRGTRWALLLRPHFNVKGSEAFGPAVTGMALNAVLPARVGDLARISLGAQRFRASAAFVAGTVVVERILDAAVLLALLAGSVAMMDPGGDATVEILGYSLNTDVLIQGGQRLGKFTLLLLAAALVVLWRPVRQRVLAALSRIPTYGPRIRARVEPQLYEAARGLGTVARPRIFGGALVLTLIIWLALTASNLLVARAIEGVELNFLQAIAVTALAVGASFLPSAPGAWGLYEAGALLALTIVGALPEDSGIALAFVLLSHLATYLPTIIAGAVVSVVGRSGPSGARPQVDLT